ncbi:hypothetical protein GE21DRAFT_284 [Neurospora crassa]|uniref:Uncharacterized protein n=1 Tax=Neurospora crassa (strain ATCC 24698 / 74-OR23-1A / CBS 708.71 / DSM 1257 / FGSC 987) TaxID=367110 RepID=Q7SE33_NEUCR|nr:hypothetical protein NCU02143 [Neurospora crassa OR74A]EAA35065.1 hypothetical protein NCU02143 [Neurospora crassa OR74A]KHE83946.1 hypothetical protein GE21DRAFT_284 [Neurospora crassa]|eukprot:XP_964301.1 hypothetical protein NCU02143 [Neurospora crassa OR74A]
MFEAAEMASEYTILRRARFIAKRGFREDPASMKKTSLVGDKCIVWGMATKLQKLKYKNPKLAE